jgi:4-amino-4-deoxy-L-arabinose transferase-like glycosyltransferase
VVPVALLGIATGGLVLRLTEIGTLGFNSDEAVYAGQAAALAGNPEYVGLFPVFRAHPMLVQTLLAPLYRTGQVDTAGRVVVAALGALTVLVVYLIGRDLYDRRVGLLASAVVAAMPYHVLPTRQVLLDGPMTLLTALALWTLARYALTQHGLWLVTSGALLGTAMLAKETSVVMLGAYYAFFALSPTVRLRWRDAAYGLAALLLVFAVHPVTVALSGHVATGKNYLVWQLLRDPNHGWTFYPAVVTWSVGPLVLLAALGGLFWARHTGTWREILLGAWVVVPVVVFELWPVKGFQYLLPIVPALAVLAARGVLTLPLPDALRRPMAVRGGLVVVLLASLLFPSLRAVTGSGSATFLAGTGGVPGGRGAGTWVAENTPDGAVLLTLGPSMANIVQYYGHRRAYGLAVSPNPLRRNPSYEPVVNPDLALRYNEMQYIVWDSYSAGRSPFFSERLLTLVRRYNGREVHTESVQEAGPDGPDDRVVIRIFEVRP